MCRKQMQSNWNFTPTPVDRKNLRVLFKMTGDYSYCAPQLDAIRFENVYPHDRTKKESVAAVKRVCRTQLHMEPPSRVKLCAKYTLHSCYRLSSLTAQHTNSSVVG
jgi:hypothetical protein